MKPLFLLCNDDGIHAKGLDVFAQALSLLGDLYIVAPAGEKSGASHSITLTQPLRLEKLPDRSYSQQVYSVTGSPADCVMMAFDKVLPRKPDYVFSGINRGANLGVDTLYSGTVGAAMEAAMEGVPAMAVSSCGRFGDHFHYEAAASIACELFAMRKDLCWDSGCTLNLNVPALPREAIGGIRPAVPGKPVHDKSFYQNLDPLGLPYYWLGPSGTSFVQDEETDCFLVDKGFATLSVLRPSFLDEKKHAMMSENLKKIF